jgi:alkanesulfonate monooxygenase SsuD/methylene tetrahydromethanopterin reductase-like flavin-dependent oxidoreductase (luciferase family)
LAGRLRALAATPGADDGWWRREQPVAADRSGHGGFPLTGTPEQVADGILALRDAGFRGTTLSFVDYVEEFPYFRDNVLPILEANGLRRPWRPAKVGSADSN